MTEFRRGLCLFILIAGFALLSSGGCGGSSDSSVQSKAVMHGEVPAELVTMLQSDSSVPDTHVFGKNYLAGVPSEGTEQQTYQRDYYNGFRFVFTEPTEADLRRFISLVKEEEELLYIAGDYTHSPLTGLARETDGNLRVFIHDLTRAVVSAPGLGPEEADIPAVTERSDPEAEPGSESGRSEYRDVIGPNLLVWLKEKPAEAEAQPVGSDGAPKGRRGTAHGENLMKKLKTFEHSVSTGLLTEGGYEKPVMINNYITPLHKFSGNYTGGEDYYLIRQECIFNGGEGYSFLRAGAFFTSRLTGKRYHVGNGDVADCYMYRYEVKNEFEPSSETGSSLCASSPAESEGREAEVSVSEWSLTGKLAGESAAGRNSAEYGTFFSPDRKESFDISQIKLERYTEDVPGGKSIRWKHSLTEPEYLGSARIKPGAEQGFTTYRPVHTWVWGGKDITGADNFKMSFQARAGALLTYEGGSLTPVKRTNFFNRSWKIPLPQTPKFAITKDTLVFSKASESKEIEYASESPLRIPAAEEEWLRLSCTEDAITVKAAPNDTGEERSTVVTIETEDGSVIQPLRIIQRAE